MAKTESGIISTVHEPGRTPLLHSCAGVLVLTLLSGCEEIAGTLIDAADIGYCYGCDWIMQEWYDGWETHNSDPYDDEAACEQKLTTLQQRNRDLGYRCINEEELIDMRREESRNPSPVERVELEPCWRCDWVLQEWHYDAWERRDTTIYKNQSLCEQALWYRSKTNPYEEYQCVY